MRRLKGGRRLFGDWGPLVRHISYPTSPELRKTLGVDGHYFELDNDEYVQTEHQPAGASVVWSTAYGLLELLKNVEDKLGPPSETEEGVIISPKGKVTQASVEVASMVHHAPEDVRYFMASYDGVLLSWRYPRVKMKDGSVPFAECGIAGPQIPISLLAELVESTATDHVKVALDKDPQPIVTSLGDAALRS